MLFRMFLNMDESSLACFILLCLNIKMKYISTNKKSIRFRHHQQFSISPLASNIADVYVMRM